jgi:hypothetical protein
MNWTSIFNGIGNFFEWTFKFMKHPGDGFAVNLFFWIIIVVLYFTWLIMQAKYNKEAKANNQLP